MLTLAALGLVVYGGYEIVGAAADLFGARRLEPLVDVITIVLALMLTLAAALVRVLVPGGIPLAGGALLGFQALALHNASHLYGGPAGPLQLMRAAVGALLILLAYVGGKRTRTSTR
jgi:hypothetical protein